MAISKSGFTNLQMTVLSITFVQGWNSRGFVHPALLIAGTLAGIVKNLQTLTSQYFNKDYDNGTKQKRTEYK